MGVSNTSSRLKPGSVVRCRTRRYLVEEVQPPIHRAVPEGGDRVVTLACMEDDAIGQRLSVFLSSEIDFEVLGESSWEVVAQRGFDQPRQFSAYLNTLRWNCVTATDADLFQAPYRAGIDVKAYQLEPLRKALHMPRVGLFIADDVLARLLALNAVRYAEEVALGLHSKGGRKAAPEAAPGGKRRGRPAKAADSADNEQIGLAL